MHFFLDKTKFLSILYIRNKNKNKEGKMNKKKENKDKKLKKFIFRMLDCDNDYFARFNRIYKKLKGGSKNDS